MKDKYTTNSHYLTHTFLFERLGEYRFWSQVIFLTCSCQCDSAFKQQKRDRLIPVPGTLLFEPGTDTGTWAIEGRKRGVCSLVENNREHVSIVQRGFRLKNT